MVGWMDGMIDGWDDGWKDPQAGRQMIDCWMDGLSVRIECIYRLVGR